MAGSGIQSHRDLLVWQRGMELVEEVYRLGRRFPREERYGLWAQVTRAAVSVPANVAEGRARGTRKDYAAFLAIARGSLAEVDTLLEVARRLGYLEPRELERAVALLAETDKMLAALRRKLLAAVR